MEALVINLARSTDRMAFQRRQLAALGLAHERLEAVTAEDAARRRPESYWQGWERPLRPAERACLMSHVAAWERIAASGRPTLVLEDDAVLSRRVPALLSALETLGGIDHVTLEARGRKKLLGREALPVLAGVALVRLYQDRTGAAAYVLWPSGASRLLARAARAAALADAMICRAYELESWQVEPACAIQLDRCGHFGIPAPIATRSTIDGDSPTRPTPSTAQRMRRISAQLRMALRHLFLVGRAERREVRLDPADFV